MQGQPGLSHILIKLTPGLQGLELWPQKWKRCSWKKSLISFSKVNELVFTRQQSGHLVNDSSESETMENHSANAPHAVSVKKTAHVKGTKCK